MKTQLLDDGLYVVNDNEIAAFSPQNDEIESHVIEIPEGITRIGRSAFAGIENIKIIILPDSLEVIGEDAFSMSSIEEVYFGRGLTKIEQKAFSNCLSIKSLTLPENLVSIGNGVFRGCKNLENIILDDALKFIGSAAFYGCKGLKKIELPASVNAIGNEAFFDMAEVTIKGGYIPHNFTGALTTHYDEFAKKYLENSGRLSVKVNFKGESIFLPKYINENSVSMCECAFSSGIEEMTQNLYEFGLGGEVIYDTAYWQYKSIVDSGKEPSERLKKYVKRMSKNIFITLFEHGLEEEQLYFIKLGLLTQNALNKLYETVKDENPVVAACLLDEIEASGKATQAESEDKVSLAELESLLTKLESKMTKK